MKTKSIFTLTSLLLLFSVAAAANGQQTGRGLYVGLLDRGEYDKATFVLELLTKERTSNLSDTGWMNSRSVRPNRSISNLQPNQ